MRGSAPRFDGRRIAKAVARAAIVLASAGIVAVLPELFPILPRATRVLLADRFLRAALVVYWAALLPALAGGAVAIALLVRARRAGERRPAAARCLLLCASTLLGVGILEAASAAWLAWAHRFPSLPTRFPPAPDGELRVAVIGGSSAKGQPYQDRLSIGTIVAWKLQSARPDRRVVAEVLAREGATLEEMHQKLARIRRRPDVLIVFAGHNEYQARFPWDQDGDVGVGLLPYLRKVVMEDGLGSPFARAVSEASSKYRLMEPPRMTGRGPIERPIVGPGTTERLRREFGRRLDAIVSWCERVGALPVLVIPADNESGFEPNRSVLPDATSPAERRAFARAWLEARASESDPEAAMARYRALIARQPGFAEAHFRLGRLLERSGRFALAGEEYRLARDLDGFPQRCTSPFQEEYRRVAARHGCILIEGAAELRALSPHGILDDHLLNDGHHPSLRGHVALAEAVLRELHGRRALGRSDGAAPSIDPAECAAHFGLDDRAWAGVCRKIASFYTVTAHCRYDPAERLDKAALFNRAADRIEAGTLPAALGIPGIGLSAGPRADRANGPAGRLPAGSESKGRDRRQGSEEGSRANRDGNGVQADPSSSGH